jgi:hypothetical protein
MSENDNNENDNLINDYPTTQSEFERIQRIQHELNMNYANQGKTRKPPDIFSFLRYIGFNRTITINNISGKDAWIILSPAPIFTISSFSIDNVGGISFNNTGSYKCQQSPLKNDSARDFDLDNNQIYYSVFFNCEKGWKVHFKDIKINATKYDINLLERHVNESVDYEFISKL